MNSKLFVSGFIMGLSLLTVGASDKPAVMYASDIKPVFEKSCIKCHGPERQKAQLRLDSREAVLKKDKLVHAGNSADSLLTRVISQFGGPSGKHRKLKAQPLPAEQIELVKKWIDQGAK